MSAGKGSSPRPYSIPAEEFAARHEAIFGKKQKPRYVPPPLPDASLKEAADKRLMAAFDSYCANTESHRNENGDIVLDTPYIKMLRRAKDVDAKEQQS